MELVARTQCRTPIEDRNLIVKIETEGTSMGHGSMDKPEHASKEDLKIGGDHHDLGDLRPEDLRRWRSSK